jgi:hypothetical protein
MKASEQHIEKQRMEVGDTKRQNIMVQDRMKQLEF